MAIQPIFNGEAIQSVTDKLNISFQQLNNLGNIPDFSSIENQLNAKATLVDLQNFETAFNNALALKADTTLIPDISNLQTQIDTKATLTQVESFEIAFNSALDLKINVETFNIYADDTGVELDTKATLVDLQNFETAFNSALDLKADITHIQTIDTITGLQLALDNKANITQLTSFETDFNLALSVKADIALIPDVSQFETSSQIDIRDTANRARNNHTGLQPINTVTGLQAALDAKAALVHNQAINTVTGLQAALDAKAALVHDQAINTVTGLQAALDAKAAVTAISNVGFSGTYSDLNNKPFGGATYEQTAEPSNPINGEIWIERNSDGFLLATWERVNNLWLSVEQYVGNGERINLSSSNNITYPNTGSLENTVWVSGIRLKIFIAGSASAENFWTVSPFRQAYLRNSGGITTSSNLFPEVPNIILDAATIWQTFNIAVQQLAQPVEEGLLSLATFFAKTGTPGNVSGAGIITTRRVR